MSGKEVRIARLLNPESGKAVIIPVDHGTILGSVAGLTDPVGTLEKLIELKIDATLLGTGLAKITGDLFKRKDAPGRILTADFPLLSSVPGLNDGATHNIATGSVEFVLRENYDAMKIILLWGLDREQQLRNIKILADLGEACDRWGIPLMVEPMLWGHGIAADRKNDPILIENAARIALETGADILKIPYFADKAAFSDLVRRFRVPVMVLGGPKMGSARDVLQTADDSVKAGAVAVVFGRNVWQNPSMENMVRALQDIVHRGSTVESVAEKYGF